MEQYFYHFDAAKKIADAFEVSMDYLVGEGVNVSFDKKILNACRILRSLMMLLKINSTSLLITLFKTLKLKKLTQGKNNKAALLRLCDVIYVWSINPCFSKIGSMFSLVSSTFSSNCLTLLTFFSFIALSNFGIKPLTQSRSFTVIPLYLLSII
ncbi:MAG: hypothetical protein ACOYLO_10450 [Ferruginibacter sp.]